MTKSQNTKNEQQKDLCITSEQLKEEYEKECKRADELEDSYWKAEKENTKLKELLNTIKKQCELLIPKNGLSPVGARERLCKAFLNLIDEVLK